MHRGPFRIRTVSELTSVPEPTLRAWERRYGLPRPSRTSSGYRMYSALEVEQVRRMKVLCERGVPAADAARTIRAESVDGDLPSGSTLDPNAASLRAILDAVSRFDDRLLEVEVRKLMFLGSTGAIVDNVVTPALRRIGELWQAGQLSVGQEHFASQRLGTLLRDLLRLSRGADSEASVLLACFADDEHELGLLTAAVRLSDWGFRPLFLGAKTPPSAVRGSIAALAPSLVAFSVTVAPGRARALELVTEYAAACGRVPWVVGGAGVADVADLVRSQGGVVAEDGSSALFDTARAVLARVTAAARKRA